MSCDPGTDHMTWGVSDGGAGDTGWGRRSRGGSPGGAAGEGAAGTGQECEGGGPGSHRAGHRKWRLPCVPCVGSRQCHGHAI